MPDDLSQREGEVNDGLRARWVAEGNITNESHGRIKRGGVEARATGTPPTLDTHPFFILSLLFHVTFPPPTTTTTPKYQEWSAAQLDDSFRADGTQVIDGAAAAAAPAAKLPPPAPSQPAAASTSYEARLEHDASAAVAADPRAAADPAVLALSLRRVGHDAFVRRALGNAGKRRPPPVGARGGSRSAGGGEEGAAAAAPVVAPPLRSRAIFETLSHAFVVVRPPAAQEQPESLLVVDAGFRDAVAVAAPPPALERVLDALPRVFVGGAAKLAAAVGLVAAETRQALEAEGRPLPPWRSARALLSKWMPQGAGAVADERPSEGAGGAAGGEPPSSFSPRSSAAAAADAVAAASGLSPPTSPVCATAGCCSPFSSGGRHVGGGGAFSTSPEGPFAATAAAAVPPTALGGGGSKNAATPPIALVAPPLVARLSVSLLSSSLARVSASASSAAASAAKATAAMMAAADEMRPVRRATWAPAA